VVRHRSSERLVGAPAHPAVSDHPDPRDTPVPQLNVGKAAALTFTGQLKFSTVILVQNVLNLCVMLVVSSCRAEETLHHVEVSQQGHCPSSPLRKQPGLQAGLIVTGSVPAAVHLRFRAAQDLMCEMAGRAHQLKAVSSLGLLLGRYRVRRTE